MAQLPSGAINTTETTRTAPEGTPLPAGVYTGIVTRTAQRETNDRTGIFIEVEIDITSPEEHQTRKFWDRFNIVNKSADAARIGKECLADLGLAAGFEILEDDEQLQGQEVMMELIVEPAKPYTKDGVQHPGKAQNKCRKYWRVGTDIDATKASQKAAKSGVAPAQGQPAANNAAASGPRKWGANTAATPAAAASSPPAQVQQAQPAQNAAPAAAAQPAAAGAQRAPWKRQ